MEQNPKISKILYYSNGKKKTIPKQNLAKVRQTFFCQVMISQGGSSIISYVVMDRYMLKKFNAYALCS